MMKKQVWQKLASVLVGVGALLNGTGAYGSDRDKKGVRTQQEAVPVPTYMHSCAYIGGDEAYYAVLTNKGLFTRPLRGSLAPESDFVIPSPPYLAKPTFTTLSSFVLESDAASQDAIEAVSYIVTGASDGVVRIYDGRVWNDTIRTPVKEFRSGVSAVSAVTSFAHSGKAYAVAGFNDGSIRIWDVFSVTQDSWTLLNHTGGITALSSLVDEAGRLYVLSGSFDRGIHVFQAETATERLSWTSIFSNQDQHRGYISAASLFFDGQNRVLAAEADGYGHGVLVWDVLSKNLLCTWTKHTSFITAISPIWVKDQLYILSAGTLGKDCAVHMWDPMQGAGNGKLIQKFPLHTSRISGLSSAKSDGSEVLCAFQDGEMSVIKGKEEKAIHGRYAPE